MNPKQASGFILGSLGSTPAVAKAIGSAPPGVKTVEAIDSLLARIARSKTEQALLDAYRQNLSTPGAYKATRPLQLLLEASPDEIARIDQFAGDHGLDIGKQLGAGYESSVLGTSGQFRGDPTRGRVLKIAVRDRMLAKDAGFDLPRNVPGVAGYDAVEDFGPIRAALQPRVRTLGGNAVPDGGTGWDVAGRLHDSLRSRGFRWEDDHTGNLGELDGEWAVIDGIVTPIDVPQPRKYQTAEEAIRALRLLPGEEGLLNPY